MASNPQEPRRMLLPPIGTFSPSENTEHDKGEYCADAGCTPVDRAASPLPAEPPPTRTCWHTTCPMCGVPFPATPSAAEPPPARVRIGWMDSFDFEYHIDGCDMCGVKVFGDEDDLRRYKPCIDKGPPEEHGCTAIKVEIREVPRDYTIPGPQRMANTNCWNWLHDIDLTLNTCLAVTVNPQAFDLPQVRANIDASRRAVENLKTLLNDALKAEPQKEE